ncbi:hypothetical protein SCHPADRAFT_852122 [Schizopora paradoxa]|uniref:C3H1-type domain-containing protein n=1 Tax=Schizopora paradoxa TaxID=27342 RepID=A0A0H2SA18_9AGAM|nr:hypothetical protein SCHPADRAFT_852122 [Schizopora paradoxa]
MSQADVGNDNASNVDGSDKGENRDKSSKPKSGGSKSKDLSHVPCKFFKVGSCTAGSSCPFSHQSLEPGQQKDVCAWFVKGNCKFGHKCALAHVLPGQSMNMDRRNKKAAQLASTGQAGKEKDGGRGEKSNRSQRSGADPSGTSSRTGSNGQVRNSLLTGPTAPTRVLPLGGRPPMSISKAAPAPPATAPTLNDNDFTSFDMAKPDAGAEKSEQDLSARDNGVDAAANGTSSNPNLGLSPPPSQTSFIPISTPTEPKRFTGRHGASPKVDFGPVGSPPRSSPSNPIRINGFSPGSSPLQPASLAAPTSTFSAPGPSAQSLFMSFERTQNEDVLKSRSGLAMSLGATNGFNLMSSTASIGQKPNMSSSSTASAFSTGFGIMPDVSLDDDDMEEFVPSSLKDLLTPEEQIRRITRTTSSNVTASINNNNLSPSYVQANNVGLQDSQQHRYSRSVPAQSILQDIRSIWTEPSLQTGRSPQQMSFDRDQHNQNLISSGLGIGAPSSSFKASSLLKSAYDEGPSPSMLSPSNASAAFLPGLHQQYLSRAGSRNGMPTMSASRTVSHGHVPMQLPSSLSQEISQDFAAPHPNQFAPPPPSSANSLSSGLGHALFNNDFQHPSGRPIPSNGGYPGPDMPLFSPSTRALQAHAPGQSLPQGLAAGYSRIHLQPGASGLSPNSAAFSPSNLGLGVTPPIGEFDNSNGGLDWRGLTPTTKPVVGPPAAAEKSVVTPTTPVPQQATPTPSGGENGIAQAALTPAGADGEVSGLSNMFSRLSYSAAASRGTAAAAASNANATNAPSSPPISASSVGMVPMSMSRKTSGGRAWPGGAQPLSSPLSKPAISNDDDELFSWDEEK